MTEYITIKSILDHLHQVDNIVEVKKIKGRGYFLHIGEGLCDNAWLVTEKELRILKDILNKKFK